MSESRPLYAGCRLPSNQMSDKLVPEGYAAPGFDSISSLRRVISGFTFVRLSDTYRVQVSLHFVPNAHHHDS